MDGVRKRGRGFDGPGREKRESPSSKISSAVLSIGMEEN